MAGHPGVGYRGLASAADPRLFVQPTAADEMLTELNDLTSPVSVFVRECCHIGPEYEVQRGALYEAYTEWAKEHGRNRIEDEAGFGREFGRPCPAIRKSNTE